MDKRIIIFIGAFIVMLVIVIFSLHISVQERKTGPLPAVKGQVIEKQILKKDKPDRRDRKTLFRQQQNRVPVDSDPPSG
ncbi:MAG: hypothetical protein PHQ57_01980 [Candidatus Omnitrophica bacterium]|nr:hypothetical protein [Candidatus Omnitrophota bacterium]